MRTRESAGTRIGGLSEEQARKFDLLLATARSVDLMNPTALPKGNWKVFGDSNPERAYEAASESAIAAAKLLFGDATGNIRKDYDDALSAALRAAHFSEPLHGEGKRSTCARLAHERAELEGLYLGRDFGSAVSRAAGRAVGLAGLMIATEGLDFGAAGVSRENALGESKEWMDALTMGYLVVGKVKGVYYVACVGAPPAAFLNDLRQ